VITLVILAIVAIYFVITYNGLVNIKHNVEKAWANIDVLLKQRHDELPKLVDTCKQYMKFEQETLEKVIQARSRASETVLANYLHWPNPTQNSKPTSSSCICSHRLAGWKMPLLTGASFIMTV